MASFLDRILGRAPAAKATMGGPALVAYNNDIPLTSLSGSGVQDRMARYLAAYKVGWFYKAGSKISRDVALLDITLAYEDDEGDNEDAIVAPENSIPFDALTPEQQFLRLMEHPNEKESGRLLRQKTQIRLDFAGAAFWYLENAGGGGLPTAIYGINPARMEPSLDAKGNLLGWVMDRNRRGTYGNGIPFDADEILLFSTASGDDEWYGTSVVEAVWSQVPLTDLIARHTADVLTMGGRLAGMAWPKDRALDENEFADVQRAWRNIATDPNAARRLLLFPEPMEYSAGAASPKDIGIPELAKLNREEITTAFPVNPYMLGLPLEPGMNSGESLKYVERQYWSNTIHDRVELLEEVIQQGLVTRYEQAIGKALDFDIEEPDLDGAVELVEKAGAMTALIALGFDPKDTVGAVGLDHIKWNGLPQPEPVDPNAPAKDETPLTVIARDTNSADSSMVQQTMSKSYEDAVKRARVDVVGVILPGFVPVVESYLSEQKARVLARLSDVYGPLTKAQRKALPDDWWIEAEERAEAEKTFRQLYVTLARTGLTVVANEVDRFVMPERIKRVTEAVLDEAGKRITQITETTRTAITETLAVAVQRGYTLNQMLYGYPAENFKGIAHLDVWEPWRAERIARTETMRAYNDASLRGYKEFNVTHVNASDGIGDDECQARVAKNPWTIEEAMGIEDHPNGTLDWIPIVPDRKSADRGELYDFALKALELAARPQPSPTFLLGTDSVVQALQPQAVNVPPPDLDPLLAEVKALGEDIRAIRPPEVKVAPTPVIVNVDKVRVTSLPDRIHAVQRDKTGKPTGSVETDA